MGLMLSWKYGRKPILSSIEEEKVVKHIHGMPRYGYLVNFTKLKIKEAKATQLQDIPFKDGIPRPSWLQWFWKRHLEIPLCVLQGLDVGKAEELCPKHVLTFYDNLEIMLQRGYEPNYIWNCDESEMQAGRNRGRQLLAKRGRERTFDHLKRAMVAFCISVR